jgi:hypothetical protein
MPFDCRSDLIIPEAFKSVRRHRGIVLVVAAELSYNLCKQVLGFLGYHKMDNG